MVIIVKEGIVIHNITHKQIEIQIQEELLRVLEKVPMLSNVDVFISKNSEYDIEVSGNNDKEKLNIICEVKKKGEPQYIRAAAERLLKLKINLEKEKGSSCYCMIAAPYISDASSKICEELGIGYIDLSGNCLLKHKSIYIRIEGKPNKYSDTRGSKSIYERSSVRSSIILRLLLQNTYKAWKMQELAEASKSSIGQVSKVKKFLEERDLIFLGDNGFRINKPNVVIEEWAKVYNSKSNTIYECYSIDNIPQIEQRLVEMKKDKGIECVLTGFSGGVRYAPTVRYNKIHVYIQLQDLPEALDYLDCKKVSSGSNISIIEPYDSCILNDAREINNNLIASPIQVCLDLLGLKGRGEEAAYAIMDKEFETK